MSAEDQGERGRSSVMPTIPIIMRMSSTRLTAILSGLWILVVLLGAHVWPGIFPPLRPVMLVLHVLVLALVAAAAWGWGTLALWWMRWPRGETAQRALFEIGAGLGALAMLVFLLAAASLLYRPAALVVLGV